MIKNLRSIVLCSSIGFVFSSCVLATNLAENQELMTPVTGNVELPEPIDSDEIQAVQINSKTRYFDFFCTGKGRIQKLELIVTKNGTPTFTKLGKNRGAVFAKPTPMGTVRMPEGYQGYINIELGAVKGKFEDYEKHLCLGVKKQGENSYISRLYKPSHLSTSVYATDKDIVELVPLLSKTDMESEGYTPVKEDEPVSNYFDEIPSSFDFGSVYRVGISYGNEKSPNEPVETVQISNENSEETKHNEIATSQGATEVQKNEENKSAKVDWWYNSKLSSMFFSARYCTTGSIIDEDGKVHDNQLIAWFDRREGCGDVLYCAYSSDGIHWLRTGIPAVDRRSDKFIIYGNGVWCGIVKEDSNSSNYSLFRSTDNRQTWSKVDNVPRVNYYKDRHISLELKFCDGVFGLHSKDGYFYMSTDAENWTKIEEVCCRQINDFVISRDGTVMYTAKNGDHSGTYRKNKDKQEELVNSYNGSYDCLCVHNGQYYCINSQILSRLNEKEWEKLTKLDLGACFGTRNYAYYNSKFYVFNSGVEIVEILDQGTPSERVKKTYARTRFYTTEDIKQFSVH